MSSTFFISTQRQRIGLMGGSFNPAHEGHLHVSRLALRTIDLDEVWWLVSPQNPLKHSDGMAGFDDRFRVAEAVTASDHRIRIVDLENRLGTQFTADTLDILLPRFPRLSFVWIMGADNLLQINRWQRWKTIFERVPVAVFARAPYSRNAMAAVAAKRFSRNRVASHQARNLATMVPPAWSFFHVPVNLQSATRIRDESRNHEAESTVNEIVNSSG